jgi:hypothetical protein
MATGVRTAPIGFVGNRQDLYQKNVLFYDLASEIRRCGPKMKESLPTPFSTVSKDNGAAASNLGIQTTRRPPLRLTDLLGLVVASHGSWL